jgi:hypothetical protein
MESKIISQLYLLPSARIAPEKYQKAFRGLSARFQGNAVPWQLTVPEKAYRAIIKDQEEYAGEVQNLDLSYVHKIYEPTNQLFDFLQPAKINTEKYKQYINLDTTSHAESFAPSEEGYARPVEYDRLSTITGRLKTVSGPRILLLPKVYRGIMESRWGTKGKIISLDYSSLEPRTLLAVSGGQPIERDVYTHIKDYLFGNINNVNRATVKKIVLSELYGAGLESIKEKLPGVQDVAWIVNEIRNYFGIEKLKEKLYSEWVSTGQRYITNFYGRRVKTENTHTLINHYVQSTAVDISLQGFLNILQFLKEMDRLLDIVPLFILHDAIILDVNENAFTLLNALCKIGSTDINGLSETKFYMSVDKEFALT